MSKLPTVCVGLFAMSVMAAGQNPGDLAQLLGISFPANSQNTVLLTRNGKQYEMNTVTRTVHELGTVAGPAAGAGTLFGANCAPCHGADGKGIKAVGTPNFTDPAFQRSSNAGQMQKTIHDGIAGRMPAWSAKLSDTEISELVVYVRGLAPGIQAEKPPQNIYQPGDDVLVSLPTGKPTDRHGVHVNFSHRFAYDPTFTGTGRGQELFGLDGVALSSFGVRYGVTDNLSVSIYRSPSLINRPIQLMAGYSILEERKGDLLNLMVRASIEGQNNFRKNYTENIEAILSRSITKRAQVYLVPTISLNNRRLVQPNGFSSDQIADVPGVNSMSLGIGVSLDIRPTVALLAEAIPTLINADELGIHRPAFSLGIQKKIYRHAFTLALTNSPGTTVSQRGGTRATFLDDPSADTFGGLVLGFNITRQTH